MNPITLYAAIAAFLFLVLTFRTIALRVKFRTTIGDGGQDALCRAIRAHSNFAEYTPLALVLLYLISVSGGGALLLHALGISLVLGRVLHAIGISQTKEPLPLRQAGMLLTTGTLIVSTGWLLLHYFSVGT